LSINFKVFSFQIPQGRTLQYDFRMGVKLRSGATVEQAITGLDQEAANIDANTASTSYNADIIFQSNEARNLYVKWSIEAEGRLIGSLHRDEVLSIFSNSRHRDISLMPPGLQLHRSIFAEVSSKRELFAAMSRDLKETQSRLTKSAGLSSIVDTNFMIHCLRPDQIKWKSLNENVLRLVIPLRVIEELDAMKTDNKERLRKNSREILSWLESLFKGSTGPVKIRADEDTTIEILLSERPRYRPSDPDEEVLDICHEFVRFVGSALLVTADYGMRLRARAESINVLLMPTKYFKTGPNTSAQSPSES
jgi:rRNA-processing protein FCF1